jgi:hypothetical protein
MRGNRGRGYGRAPGNRTQRKWVLRTNGGQKRKSAEAGLGMDPMEDLDDTTTSPMKQADGERIVLIGTNFGPISIWT